jgi:Phospho-N-acetylmuramoyl-pentapeptide-transferase signature 1
MLLSLAQWLQSLYPEALGFLRVFQYLTFRAVLAAMTALLIGLALGPWVIGRLKALKIGQPIRAYGVAEHLAKSGTPTMGGVLILVGITVSTLLWFDWSNRFVWIVLMVTLGFGAVGWADDWRKVVHKNPEGMASREKFFWQSLIGLVAAIYLAFSVCTLGTKWLCQQLAAQSRFNDSVCQEHQLPAGGFRFHYFDLCGDRGYQQCRQYDGRLGRLGNHAGGDGGLSAGRVCLCGGQFGLL